MSLAQWFAERADWLTPGLTLAVVIACIVGDLWTGRHEIAAERRAARERTAKLRAAAREAVLSRLPDEGAEPPPPVGGWGRTATVVPMGRRGAR